MLLTVFSTKDTGGPRLLRILPTCPKIYCEEIGLKVYISLTATVSVRLIFAKANAFPIIYQKLWHICTLAVPVKIRPDLKHSLVKDPADSTQKSSRKDLLTYWLHADLYA